MNFELGKLFLLVIFFLAGCGPGVSDYSEKIGKTGLLFIDDGPLNRGIFKESSDDGWEALIESSVLFYRVYGKYVVGVRQVVNHYVCDSTRSDVEVTDRIEYFAIEVDKDSHHYGVQTFGTILEFSVFMEGVELREQVSDYINASEFQEKMLPVSLLGECFSPRLVNG